ncbi:MAG TPA: signal recognition particle-docking protein FtsY [Candidatus Marinimicrobia bacterium]|nr:signal recognition particle-docking protein FtsY [Candidatus Neomarinimicrobiota bacterium]HRS50927.1 signal recognition particle-docking protein FtsY [Candidatus Neomarinimicrobiota bacterium]HRU91731.1 signal recognition particle-docking protein FtsY [Candidatus Neomarinimicrobiota bacterium]
MINFGLNKTGRFLASRLPLLGRFFRIDEKTLEEIEETLIQTDLGVELTDILIERLRKVDRKEAARLNEILLKELSALIQPAVASKANFSKPTVILIVGVNGTGKTTTIGKLAAKYASEGQRVLICAADTFRAAAYEQLRIWAERSGVEFIGNPQGKDPSAIAFDAARAAQARNADILLIDTAGRLHTKSNLMEELAKVKRVIGKVIPDAPHEVWLVLDATVGQNGILQAREFQKAIGVTGLILTKLDGTAKGGIALAIHRELNIPIRFLGVGEKLTDLVEFDPNQYVRSLLGIE